jgi:hypothetical protein
MFMNARKSVLGLAAAAAMALAPMGSHASNLLSEDFEDFAALVGLGWVFTNASSSPSQPWFAGNPGIFAAQAGAAGSYAAANFLSSSAVSGVISNWMITPAIEVTGSEILTFYARMADVGYLDGINLHLSVGGGTAIGDFAQVGSTGVLGTDWTAFTLQLPDFGAPTTVRIGFQYAVADALDANYIGIDSVTLAPIPEPGTVLLMGLGVAGLLLRRRLAA